MRINVQQALTSDWLRDALPTPALAREGTTTPVLYPTNDSKQTLTTPATHINSRGSSGVVDLDLCGHNDDLQGHKPSALTEVVEHNVADSANHSKVKGGDESNIMMPTSSENHASAMSNSNMGVSDVAIWAGSPSEKRSKRNGKGSAM